MKRISGIDNFFKGRGVRIEVKTVFGPCCNPKIVPLNSQYSVGWAWTSSVPSCMLLFLAFCLDLWFFRLKESLLLSGFLTSSFLNSKEFLDFYPFSFILKCIWIYLNVWIFEHIWISDYLKIWMYLNIWILEYLNIFVHMLLSFLWTK